MVAAGWSPRNWTLVPHRCKAAHHYKGSRLTPALIDQISGQIETAFTTALAVLPYTRSGTMGGITLGNTPDEFTAFVKAEAGKWGKVVKAAGIRGEQAQVPLCTLPFSFHHPTRHRTDASRTRSDTVGSFGPNRRPTTAHSDNPSPHHFAL